MFRVLVSSNRGSAAVFSLLILLVLTMAGIAMMMRSKMEVQVAGNQLRHSQSLYQAESGIAEALNRLNEGNGVAEPPNADPGWGHYLVNATGASAADQSGIDQESDGFDNDADGIADEPGERYPEVVSLVSQGGSDWVRVEYQKNAGNQVLLYGDHDGDPTTSPRSNLVDGAPILRITSSASRGNTVRTVQASAVRSTFPRIPTAIYAETDNFKVSGNGFVDGNGESGIATTGTPSNIAITSKNIDGSPWVESAPMNLDLAAMFQDFADIADVSLPGNPLSLASVDLGTATQPVVIHVDGDLASNESLHGYGVLLVKGDYRSNSDFGWTGLMIVLGDVTMNGQSHLTGSLYVQGTGLEQKFTGSDRITYDENAIKMVYRTRPLQMAGWLEI